MLREFMYRYVGEVLKESQIWAEYRTGAPPNAKVELDISDIQMAVEHKIKHKNGKDPERLVISRARQFLESSSALRNISSLDYGSRLNLDSRFKKKTEFTQRPDQAMLKETADSKNNIDLPQIPKKSLPLPTAKRFCLTADNFQVFPPSRFFAPISPAPTVIVCQMRTQMPARCARAHTHTF